MMNRLKGALSAAAAFLVSFVFAEILCRLIFPAEGDVRLQRVAGSADSNVSPNGPDSLFVENDGVLGLQPQIRAVISKHPQSNREVVITTNSLGLRGPEPRGSEIPKLLFVGDSVTFADAASDHETFVARICEGDFRGYDCLNAGVNGAGLRSYRAYLEKILQRVRPAAIIVEIYLNDYRESPTVWKPKPPKLFSSSRLVQQVYRAASLLDISLRLWNLHRKNALSADAVAAILREGQQPVDEAEVERTARYISENAFDFGGAWSESGTREFQEGIKELKSFAEQRSIPLYGALFPVAFQVDSKALYDQPQVKLMEISKELQLPAIDLLPVFRGARGENLFFDQCHLTENGHAAVAAELQRWLKEQLMPADPPHTAFLIR